MNEANLSKSPRLRRLLAVLQDGQSRSTMTLIREASICAVNSAVSELRANGYRVVCHAARHTERGRRGKVWYYRLLSSVGTLAEVPTEGERPAATLIYG